MRVLFCDSDKFSVLLYEQGTHKTRVSKFLYWDNDGGFLFCGEAVEHHGELFDWLVLVSGNGTTIPKGIPIGAGIASDGEITDWGSDGFGIVTPYNLRPKIREALGMQDFFSA